MILLDSSAIIEIIYKSNKSKVILDLIKDKPVCTSSFSVYEIIFCLKEKEKIKVENLFNELKIQSFDEKAAKESVNIERDLLKKGKPINKIDIFIAGICVNNNLKLISCDKDFLNISKLKVTVL